MRGSVEPQGQPAMSHSRWSCNLSLGFVTCCKRSGYAFFLKRGTGEYELNRAGLPHLSVVAIRRLVQCQVQAA